MPKSPEGTPSHAKLRYYEEDHARRKEVEEEVTPAGRRIAMSLSDVSGAAVASAAALAAAGNASSTPSSAIGNESEAAAGNHTGQPVQYEIDVSR